jgi:hypothetical protein
VKPRALRLRSSRASFRPAVVFVLPGFRHCRTEQVQMLAYSIVQ